MTVTSAYTLADPRAIAAELKSEVRRILRPSLDDARRLIGEAGVPKARDALRSALDALEAAQRSYREAQAVADAAKEAHDAALLDAEWELDGRFAAEGNKTFLVWPAGSGEKRPMTADERRAYKTAEARKLPAVAEAATTLRFASDAVLDARDAVTVADKRVSACTHELDASVAVLDLLAAGLAATRKD